MLSGLSFANIAHLGWAVRDIDTTIQNLEIFGLTTMRSSAAIFASYS